jgi:hypothetical protein
VRRVALAAAVAVSALAAPGTAAAHQHTGRVAVDYKGTVGQLTAALAGAVEARVYPADLSLGLTALGRHRVLVLGYAGEPFLELRPGGAYVSRSSTTAAGLGLTGAPAGHGWKRYSPKPQLIWHDARLRGLPPGVDRRRWAVPVLVDGRRADLSGTLTRVGSPPAWPWLVLGTLFGAAGAALLALRRPEAQRIGAVALGSIAGAATILVAAGFAAASTATEATWAEAANEIVIALVGMAFLRAGSRGAHAFAALLLGLLALVVGLTDLPVLLHGIVLSALPATVARSCVVLAISAGAAAAAVALVLFFGEGDDEPPLSPGS